MLTAMAMDSHEPLRDSAQYLGVRSGYHRDSEFTRS